MSAHEADNFGQELRRQLVEGGQRLTLRRRRRRSAALAASVFVAVSLVGVAAETVRSRPAAAGVRITTAGGFVTLRLTAPDVSATDIELAARGAGIDANSRSVPVGPSRVGKIIRATSDHQLPAAFSMLGTDEGFTGFRMPASWRGTLHIDFGRAATRDELYVRTSDAFAAGEPLECTQALGQPVTGVRMQLERRGYKVSLVNRGSGTAVTNDNAPDQVVGDAEVLGQRQVALHVIAVGDPPLRAPRRPQNC